jgi:hypothetical protein
MPTVNIMSYIRNQYFDDVGVPLAGGKLHTYYGGTSTNKESYQDSSGSIPHTNPIILDSAGRTTVYLASGSYKLVLKNSSDETIWSEDNISISTLLTNVDTVADLKLLAPGVSSFVQTLGYAAAGDGGGWTFWYDSTSAATNDDGMVIQPSSLPATGRWLGIPPYENNVNVRVYGAVCDGATDDAAKLQACDLWAVANNYNVLIDNDIYVSIDPTVVTSKIVLTPGTLYKYGTFNPVINVEIATLDLTRHFACVIGDVPVLNLNIIQPEWFGETIASRPITIAAIAANTSDGLLITDLNVENNTAFKGNLAVTGTSLFTGDDTHTGNILANGNIGLNADTDLIKLTSNLVNINGSLKLDNGANIGIDSDPDLLKLDSGLLTVEGSIFGKTNSSSTLGSSTRRFATTFTNNIDFATNLYIKKNTTDIMSILTGGNIGIGTISPSKKLTVYGNDADIVAQSIDSDEGTTFGLYKGIGGLPGSSTLYAPTLKTDYKNIYFSGGGFYTGYIGTDVNGHSIFAMNDTVAAVVTQTIKLDTSGDSYLNGGNVGIGTISPGYKLSVDENIDNFAARIYNAHTDGHGLFIKASDDAAHYALSVQDKAANWLLNILGNGNVGIGLSDPNATLEVLSGVTNSEVARFGSTDTNKSLRISSFASGGGNETGFDFNAPGSSGNAALSFSTLSVEAMRIDKNGNIGIGTDSPDSILNIKKNDHSDTVIGTNSIILSNLDATSGTYIAGGLFSNTYRDVSIENLTAGIWFERQNSTSLGNGSATQGAIVFGANDFNSSFAIPTEHMRITYNGNVGIGTDTPTEKLEVNGNVKATGDIFTTEWTDYSSTSTVVGWSSFNQKNINYKVVGKLVYVQFYIRGTSNANGVSFTVPYNNNASFALSGISCGTVDNAARTGPGMIFLNLSSNLVTLYKNYQLGVFTNSGTKEVYGGFFYEKA